MAIFNVCLAVNIAAGMVLISLGSAVYLRIRGSIGSGEVIDCAAVVEALHKDVVGERRTTLRKKPMFKSMTRVGVHMRV
jgi:hypothetical protein